jgi:hypothetical protein
MGCDCFRFLIAAFERNLKIALKILVAGFDSKRLCTAGKAVKKNSRD